MEQMFELLAHLTMEFIFIVLKLESVTASAINLTLNVIFVNLLNFNLFTAKQCSTLF